jgi:hypothetical protein
MALQQLRETFKRKRHDEDLLAQCVARVLAGESATAVSKEADIPYTTLLGRVNWKKTGHESASQKRQQVQALGPQASSESGNQVVAARHVALPCPEVDETVILLLMARMQHAGICVRRRDVLKKANELKDSESAECGTQWFQRFRDRHPQVSGTGTNLVLDEATMEQLSASFAAAEDPETQQRSDEVEEKEEELLTPSQRAVQVLQTDYATMLDAEDMVDAFDIMENPVVARVFLVIAPGHLRHLWLKQRIAKTREAERGTEAATS